LYQWLAEKMDAHFRVSRMISVESCNVSMNENHQQKSITGRQDALSQPGRLYLLKKLHA